MLQGKKTPSVSGVCLVIKAFVKLPFIKDIKEKKVQKYLNRLGVRWLQRARTHVYRSKTWFVFFLYSLKGKRSRPPYVTDSDHRPQQDKTLLKETAVYENRDFFFYNFIVPLYLPCGSWCNDRVRLVIICVPKEYG